MREGTEPKRAVNPGRYLAVLAGIFILMLVIPAVMAGDTSLLDPDVKHQGYPLVYVRFERGFPPRFWSAGAHAYTISVDCPGFSHDLTVTHAFVASAASASPSGNVYLRLKGVMIGRPRHYALVTDFDPARSSTALVILELDPPESAARECVASISFDGSERWPLPRTGLYSVDVDVDW